MYPVRLRAGDIPINTMILKEFEEKKQKQARKLSLDELKRKAEEEKNKKPSVRNVTAPSYYRDPDVAEYAKRVANGVCQLCKQDAPFVNKDGIPFLETHHIIRLSNGGEDTIKNTVALCPNCHRKMHILNLPNDIKILQKIKEDQ